MTLSFRANGKVLLTGEYAVLDGSLALALPTKLGQSILIEENDFPVLEWKSYDDTNNIWFETTIAVDELTNNIYHTDLDKKTRLISILGAAKKLNPHFLVNGAKIQTRLEFNPNWGLGSSSTLISLISQWAKVNPYELLNETFSGSGYDVACALADGPITYQLFEGKPKIKNVFFSPSFKDNLYFIYLNQKQDSRKGIRVYREQNSLENLTETISQLTKEIIQTNTLSEFEYLLNYHEELISKATGLDPIKSNFPDFNGSLKSLGAWGGDFIMAATEEKPNSYFQEKGFDVIFPYRDLIL